MTTATLTLTDFLLARIADDEATAESAGHGYGHQPLGSPRNAGWTDLDLSANVRPQYDVRYLQRFGPERMKAECKAKRRIVELHDNLARETDRPGGFVMAGSYRAAVERALIELAAVYADHPDYRDEWRP